MLESAGEMEGSSSDVSSSTTHLPSQPHVRVAPTPGPHVTHFFCQINRSFYVADAVQPAWDSEEETTFDPGAGAPHGPSREALADVLLGLLNNPEVCATIERELRRDPGFESLVRAHVDPGLPAPAAALMLEAGDGGGGMRAVPAGGAAGNAAARCAPGEPDPLLALLGGIAKGALAAAQRLAIGFVVRAGSRGARCRPSPPFATAAARTARTLPSSRSAPAELFSLPCPSFQRLGGFLRVLAAEMAESLRATRQQRDAAAGLGLAGEAAASIERAVVRAACAVAVLVFVRRLALLPASIS